MKVLNENTEEITVKFNKTEFRHIQNFFICNDKENLKSMCNEDEFKAVEKLVYLEDVDKGFYDELGNLLNEKKPKK